MWGAGLQARLAVFVNLPKLKKISGVRLTCDPKPYKMVGYDPLNRG